MLGLGAIGQFAIGQVGVSAGAEFIGPDKYMQWFSEPKRFLAGEKTEQQLALALFPTPVVSFSWFDWLHDPIRKKPITPAALYPYHFMQPAPSPFVATGWFNWLNDPVRIKPNFPPPEQPFLFNEQLPLVNFSYFNWLSEPVRQLVGLKFYLQRDLGRGEFIPASFTAVLNATEQGDFLNAVLSQFNIPLSALVDIITNDPTHRGNLGIIAPAPQSSIISAIASPNPAQAAGIVSPSTPVGARVAIIKQ